MAMTTGNANSMTGMKTSRRRFLAGVAAGGLTLSVPGLRQASAQSTSGDLVFWSQLAGSKKAAGDDLEAGFTKAFPSIALKSSLYADPSQLNEKLLTAISGNTPPDLFVQHWDYTLNYGSGGKLLAMTDTVAAFGAGALDEGLLAYSSAGGPLISVPLYGTSRGLGFNKALAQAAGLDPASPPKTWEEIRHWAMAMTKRTGSLLQCAGFNLFYNDLGSFELFTLFLQSAGGSMLSDDLKAPAFNGPAGLKALQFLRDLVLVDKVTDVGFGLGTGAAADPFTQKRAGLIVAGNYNINNSLKAGIDFGASAVPLEKGGGYTSYLDPFCFAVPAAASGRAQALEFIKFALSEAEQVKFALASKNVPALKAAQRDPAVQADPLLARFVEFAKYAPTKVPALPVYSRIVPIVARAVLETMYGRKEAEAALAQADVEVRAVLKGA
ncbi:extracellular solute-binding protein [Rhizobium oryzicola]|uniref:Extracellular solute-binding protein n=2 Tax=Rhizobium oryzicola TaxID=1232668 RepID=A0ABT8SW72_9HYPH|nr:extracellular solute-binding protein [Rhizobium oryzicola]MDO1582669.1 extracellular solute-binding protein [Rhizobium oryzicola]